MSARLRERKYQFKTPNGDGKSPTSVTVLGVLFAVGLFFFFIYPPVGLVWCIAVGKPLFKELIKQGVVRKNVEGKYNVDWNKAKASGQRSFEQVRAYSKDAAVKFKQHVSESDRMEERQPYKHPHNPVNYSYDSCAKDRRLEQLKSLKDAGLLDEKEYQVRKARVMAGK